MVPPWKLLIIALPISFAITSFYFQSPSPAATCDCRPEFNTEAEGNGWCSRTKENGSWCKLKFNDESIRDPAQKQKFTAAVKSLEINTDTSEATRVLNTVPPKEWNPEFVNLYMPVLFSIALWDIAPEQLRDISTILRKDRDRLFTLLTGAGGFAETNGYAVDGAPGCLQFTRRSFSTMVRTVFAPRGRVLPSGDPKSSPFITCTPKR